MRAASGRETAEYEYEYEHEYDWRRGSGSHEDGETAEHEDEHEDEDDWRSPSATPYFLLHDYYLLLRADVPERARIVRPGGGHGAAI